MNIQCSKRLAGLGLTIFTLLAALFALEIMLGVDSIRQKLGLPQPGRWEWLSKGYHRIDSELIYSMKPEYNGQWEEPAFTVKVSTNSLGLRGREIGPKVDGVKRIIVVGDSMVFGWGASDDETFPRRLEDLLNTSGKQFEVVNAGVQGYGTDQSYTLYTKRLAHLEPDILVFCLFENDVDNNIGMSLYSIKDGTLIPLAVDNHPVYILGRLQEALPAFIKKMTTYRIFSTIFANKLPYDRLPDLDMDALKAWSKRKVNLQIADLQEQASRKGFHLLVVGLPYNVGKYTDAGFYTFVEGHGDVAQKLFDMSRLPVWQEEEQALFMAGRDPHTNLSGYQLIAELLAEYIRTYSADQTVTNSTPRRSREAGNSDH